MIKLKVTTSDDVLPNRKKGRKIGYGSRVDER